MTGILVTPEGREEVWLPDRESLKKWIRAQDFDRIHNFKTSVAGMMLGADHDVADVLADIDRADRLAILTGAARRGNMNHALAIIFPETDTYPERLELFDIGDVTEADLMVVVA